MGGEHGLALASESMTGMPPAFSMYQALQERVMGLLAEAITHTHWLALPSCLALLTERC